MWPRPRRADTATGSTGVVGDGAGRDLKQAATGGSSHAHMGNAAAQTAAIGGVAADGAATDDQPVVVSLEIDAATLSAGDVGGDRAVRDDAIAIRQRDAGPAAGLVAADFNLGQVERGAEGINGAAEVVATVRSPAAVNGRSYRPACNGSFETILENGVGLQTAVDTRRKLAGIAVGVGDGCGHHGVVRQIDVGHFECEGLS